MIYAEPDLQPEDGAVLELIAQQRRALAPLTQPHRRKWMGSLRRLALAQAIQGSNSIEGYNATIDDVIGVIEDETPDERTETARALQGYRTALTYILQIERDPDFAFDKQLLKSLHFMMLSYDMSKNPGQWRPGAIWVESSRTGGRVYEGPDKDMLGALINELCEYIQAPVRQDVLVKAAMVHLNLTLIHPFSDGNGRMARALQTLILVLEGLPDPIFSSLEEWLGANTDAYYAALTTAAQGVWSPKNPSIAWVRFCLKGHYQQAERRLRQVTEYSDLWEIIGSIVIELKLHDRMTLPLLDSASGITMTNLRYQRDVGVSSHIAARDLKALADLEILEPSGETRARVYKPGAILRASREAVRIRKPQRDPYEIVRQGAARD
jgi:Fic family protein